VGFESFEAFYKSDLQSLWAVVVVPAVFLAWLALWRPFRSPGLSPPDARFVRAWCVAFGLLTVLDPVVTGPGLRALGIDSDSRGLAVVIAFVLLGDFRVLWLMLRLSGSASAAAAARAAIPWLLFAPALALSVRAGLEQVFGALPAQTIWLLYELAFAALALFLRGRILPARAAGESPALRAFLRDVATYVFVYYALWALADVAIVVLGWDAGWALRVIPNQLYYAFTVPFVWWRFFSRSYQVTSSSVHAAR
jgi:hypothetical protein